jgi:hypothetical protein
MNANLGTTGINSLLRPGIFVEMWRVLLRIAGFTIDESKNFGDVILKHYKVAVGNKTLTFFQSKATGEVGNFDSTGAKRAKGEPFYITKIRVLSGANAAVNATDWIGGVQSAELQNGTISLFCGSILLKQIPLTVFNSDGTETSQLGIYELSKPILIPEQQDFYVTIDFDVQIATANTNLGVELMGVGSFS